MAFGIATFDPSGREVSRFEGEYSRVWKVIRIESGNGVGWWGEMDAPDFPFSLGVIGDVQYGTLPPRAYSIMGVDGKLKIRWEQMAIEQGSWVGGYLLIMKS